MQGRCLFKASGLNHCPLRGKTVRGGEILGGEWGPREFALILLSFILWSLFCEIRMIYHHAEANSPTIVFPPPRPCLVIWCFTAPSIVHATEMMPSRKDNLYIIRMRGSISSVKPRWWESNTFRLSSTRYALLCFLLKEVKVP